MSILTNMVFRLAMVLGPLFIAGGCSRQEDNTPVVIKVGVDANGGPFFDWNGMMTFKTSSDGLVDFPSGAQTRASFSQPTWKSSLEIALTVKDSRDGRYSVNGTLTSPVPVRLELLGTAPNANETNSTLSFSVGTNKVQFEGKRHPLNAKQG